MESVSIPTNPVSSFGSVYECMGSWIKCPPLVDIEYIWLLHCWKIHSQQQGILAHTLSPWTPVHFDIWFSLSWLICLPPFSIFLQLLRSLFVLVFFLLYWSHDIPSLLYAILETLTLHCCYCVFECNDDSPVRQICYTVYLYACNRR